MHTIERVEDLILRMRWRLLFVKDRIKKQQKQNRDHNPDEFSDDGTEDFENFGFRTCNTPARDRDLKPFEEDLFDMIYNIKERQFTNETQALIKEDINRVRNTDRVLLAGDKTGNWFSMECQHYKKELNDVVSKDYKKMLEKEVK